MSTNGPRATSGNGGLTSPTGQRGTVIAQAFTQGPRLILAINRAERAVLDGGWWPRSWDPATELPGLVAALSARFGPVRQMLLSSGVWQGRFRRLSVDGIVVRLGWFASMDPALLIAITDRGDQIDLLVVAPSAPPAAAEQAMIAAADPNNLKRAQHLHPATPAAAVPVGNVSADKAVWDNEGGSTAANGLRR